MPKLIVEKGADKGKEFDVSTSSSLVIGRETGSFKLRDSWASRMHFKIEHRPDGFYLVDLNSMNGTYLNGKRVTESRINVGDLIKVGETMFSFVGEGGRDPLIGERLAGYRIVERVGRGGMGTVYKSEQVDLQRTVALKVISPEFAKNREFIDRFIHEARAAAKLNHPNVVQVYDVKRHLDAKRQMDVYFFSMEYMEGGSVQSLLSALKKLPPAKSVPMILDAARGLDYAHKKQIVHRDIKPDNMMLGDTGTVKIGDLGLASSPTDKATSEEEKYVLGTPHYIAPEQLLGKPADYRSDIYSLGSSLYRMLAGHAPYTGQSVQEIVNRKVREDPPPVHEVEEGVGDKLGGIVARMMARDPAQRYQTMQEVVTDLSDFNDLLRQGGKPTVRVSTEVATPAAAPARPRRLMIGAGAALAVALAVAGYFAFGRNGNPNPPPPPPPSNGDNGHVIDPEKIQFAFANAQLMKNAMKRSDEASINEVIVAFQKVVDDYPDAPQAVLAKDEIGLLKVDLRRLRLGKAIEGAERESKAAYEQFVAAFERGEDPSDEKAAGAVAACGKVAEEFKDLPEAARARNAAVPVERWIAAVGREKSEFTKLKEAVDGLKKDRHWAKAAAAIEAFGAAHKERATQAGLPDADQPFGRLLYDGRAELTRKALAEEARGDVDKFDRHIMDLVEGGEIPRAQLDLEKREPDFAFEATEKAFRKTKKALSEFVAKAEEDRVKAEADRQKKMLEEDTAKFDSMSRAAYEARRRDYSIADSIKRMETLRGELQTDAFKERVARRIEELTRIVETQDRYCEAFNKTKPTDFKAEIIGGSKKYRIVEVRRDGISFEYLDIPGQNQRREFAKIRDATKVIQLFEWEGWKEGRLKDDLAIGLFAGELGMLDTMAGWIGGVAGATSDDPEDKKAIDEAKGRLSGKIMNEAREVEGLKRVERLRALMDARDYDRAAAQYSEIDTWYGDTGAARESRGQLDAWRSEIEKMRGDAFKERTRTESRARADRFLKPEVAATEKTVAETPRRLANAKFSEADQGSREAFTGIFLAGAYSAGPATQTLKKATDIAEKAAADEISRVVILNAYMAWAEATAIAGEGALLPRLLDQGQRFAEKAWRGKAPPVWEKFRPWVERWAKELKAAEKEVAAIEAAWVEDADDPARAWAMADHFSSKLRDSRRARPYFWLLLQVDPVGESEHVANGDALYGYAESCFRVGDFEKALALFNEMRDKYPNHKMVQDQAAPDSCTERIRMCRDLRDAVAP